MAQACANFSSNLRLSTCFNEWEINNSLISNKKYFFPYHASNTSKKYLDRMKLKSLNPFVNSNSTSRTMKICISNNLNENEKNSNVEKFDSENDILSRIASGEFTVSTQRVDRLSGLRKFLSTTAPGRSLAKMLVEFERSYRKTFPLGMPEARGDVRAIIGQPFFIPLYSLFLVYGGVFQLSFGPKQFTIVSDAKVAKHILKDNAKSYSKGILAEILEFVMGTGLIPADGEIWIARRRAIVPALHKKYVAAMISLFSSCSERLCGKLEKYAKSGESAEMESLFSRMTLDVIGKAVFNYDFDSLSKDKGITEAVYVALREAEIRSTAPIPYWNVFPFQYLLPRLRKVNEALVLINKILDELIGICKDMVEKEDEAFYEEYMNTQDPSILHFLVASGEEVSSKQLRDDLMTMLIAGHETSAAVLTWTFYLLSKHPEVVEKLEAEVDEVLGDRFPEIEDMRKLTYTLQVINESMRLYPQPPVLIRRAMKEDKLSIYSIKKDQDIFISVWNLHRDPAVWTNPTSFIPERWSEAGRTPIAMSEKFSFLPFGGGPRKCLGDQFATFELISSIAILVRRYRLELAPDAPAVEMTTGATIHTVNGLHMNVVARTHPNSSSSMSTTSPLNSNTSSNIVVKVPEGSTEESSPIKKTIVL